MDEIVMILKEIFEPLPIFFGVDGACLGKLSGLSGVGENVFGTILTVESGFISEDESVRQDVYVIFCGLGLIEVEGRFCADYDFFHGDIILISEDLKIGKNADGI
jgi:hypothetical protein